MEDGPLDPVGNVFRSLRGLKPDRSIPWRGLIILAVIWACVTALALAFGWPQAFLNH